MTYHSIDHTGSIISTSPDTFRAQMQHLKDISSNVLSLKDVITCIQTNQPFPPKAVVLTFDDGFKNFYDFAYPILMEFGYGATVFLVPGFCGKKNQWVGQPKGIPVLDLLDWKQMVEMAENGIDFGAHTLSHSNLSELPFEQAVQEIIESKSMIEKHLERNILFFAYPYGKSNDKIRSIVEAQFIGACSTELGFLSTRSDVYSLPRIDMYYFSRNNLFELHGHPAFTIYVKLRKLFRAFRPYILFNN